ncbi:MAG: hypothetical protein IH851_03675 [Armatimonadetes bacterium]|nr:hypothetical protein [Armatimonadota bacterium]
MVWASLFAASVALPLSVQEERVPLDEVLSGLTREAGVVHSRDAAYEDVKLTVFVRDVSVDALREAVAKAVDGEWAQDTAGHRLREPAGVRDVFSRLSARNDAEREKQFQDRVDQLLNVAVEGRQRVQETERWMTEIYRLREDTANLEEIKRVFQFDRNGDLGYGTMLAALSAGQRARLFSGEPIVVSSGDSGVIPSGAVPLIHRGYIVDEFGPAPCGFIQLVLDFDPALLVLSALGGGFMHGPESAVWPNHYFGFPPTEIAGKRKIRFVDVEKEDPEAWRFLEERSAGDDSDVRWDIPLSASVWSSARRGLPAMLGEIHRTTGLQVVGETFYEKVKLDAPPAKTLGGFAQYLSEKTPYRLSFHGDYLIVRCVNAWLLREYDPPSDLAEAFETLNRRKNSWLHDFSRLYARTDPKHRAGLSLLDLDVKFGTDFHKDSPRIARALSLISQAQFLSMLGSGLPVESLDLRVRDILLSSVGVNPASAGRCQLRIAFVDFLKLSNEDGSERVSWDGSTDPEELLSAPPPYFHETSRRVLFRVEPRTHQPPVGSMYIAYYVGDRKRVKNSL